MTPLQRARADLLGLKRSTLTMRAVRGWTVEEATSTPARERSPNGSRQRYWYLRGRFAGFGRIIAERQRDAAVMKFFAENGLA